MLHFEEPSRLWLMLAAIPMAWVGLRWLGAMSGLRRASAVIARVALVGLLAALLAGASTIKTTDKLAVVGVVDVSGSVRAYGGRSGGESGGAGGGRGAVERDAIDRSWDFLRAASAERGSSSSS